MQKWVYERWCVNCNTFFLRGNYKDFNTRFMGYKRDFMYIEGHRFTDNFMRLKNRMNEDHVTHKKWQRKNKHTRRNWNCESSHFT